MLLHNKIAGLIVATVAVLSVSASPAQVAAQPSQTCFAVSLAGVAKLRFRRRSEAGWQRLSRTLLPRSIYVLDGPGRNDWEHSIPAVEELRYSLTFRTMR